MGKHLGRTAFVILALLLCRVCAAANKEITVCPDSCGDFKTVQEAIAAVPDHSESRTVIRLSPGVYQGQIVVPQSKSKVTFAGGDATQTILTYSRNVNEPDPNAESNRYRGCGVVVLADDFRAENVAFENTSGDHGQAMALRVDGDRASFEKCRMLGWQDTLLVSRGRQYFRDCFIEGRVDFIYGAATTVFDECEIRSKNGGHITAASTPESHPFGFVFLNCKLTGDPTPWKDPAVEQPATDSNAAATSAPSKKMPMADLGRPWRPFGSVAYVNCWMGDQIKPAGWDNWRNAENEKTARYREYNSTGPGANLEKRVAWSKQLTEAEVAEMTPQKILAGDDSWNPAAD
jgi:pectinesterase